MKSTSLISFSSSGSLWIDSPPSPPRKIKSLDGLYEITNPINDDLTLYYHLTICEPIVFEKVINDEKWRIVMNKEIASIEKNNTFKLVLKLKGKKPIGVK